MTIPLTAGAAWLAKVAGYKRPSGSHHPWPLGGGPAPIPIGAAFNVVRVPAASAASALRRLESLDTPTGPVLAEEHAWSFFVPLWLTDGRDIPGGLLLTGADGRQTLSCPRPGQPATRSRYWKTVPDGSGQLLEPAALAGALAYAYVTATPQWTGTEDEPPDTAERQAGAL
ncbi:hypothetical protein AB0N09_30730 [Streptomyces erythrochromogenes]|uniref:hypothetical protein n=1 Tax=Streptomyces erythrochromogenes TaxID=285574 RepID=UPI00341BD076